MDEIQKLSKITAAPVNSENIFQNIRTKLKPDVQSHYIIRNDQICECNRNNPADRLEKFNGYKCCCKVNNFKILRYFEDNWKLWYQQYNNTSESSADVQTKMRPGTYCVQLLYIIDTDGSVIARIQPGELNGMSNEVNDLFGLDSDNYHKQTYTFCPDIRKGYPFGYEYWLPRKKTDNYKINQSEFNLISKYISEESKKITNYPTSIYSFQEYSDSKKIEMKARDGYIEYLFIHVY